MSTATDPVRPAAGRRRTAPSGRRLDVTVVLAILVPLLALGALALVGAPEEPTSLSRPPTSSALTRADVVCPALDAPVLLGSASSARGRVLVRRGAMSSRPRVRPHRLSRLEDPEPTGRSAPVVVTGQGELAPGLLAGRFPVSGPLTAAPCRPPSPEGWFTGLGAAPRHSSVLSLSNPDRGRAVVDVTVYGPRGEVDVPALRGVSVPGQGQVVLDLAEVTPRRGDLTVHVQTPRGRVGAAVLDRVDTLGSGASGSDWIVAQAAPATTNTLLGVVDGDGRRELVLTNTSNDQARASLQVLTADSVFTPEGIDDVVVAPLSTVRIDLADVLTASTLPDALGLVVATTRPVTATVRSLVDDDLALMSASATISPGRTSAVLPPGTQRLVWAAAPRSGTLRVVSRAADGSVLDATRAEIGPDRAGAVDLPDGARLVEVAVAGSPVAISVVATGSGATRGAAVVPLVGLVETSLVGDVRPASR